MMTTHILRQITLSLVLLTALVATSNAQTGSQLTGGDPLPRLTEALIGQKSITLVSQPSPFSNQTAIGFVIPASGQVVIDVLDGRDKIVKTLFNSRVDAGEHAINWDGRDAEGNQVPEGPYEYRMRLVADNGLVAVTNASTIRLGR